jgi:cellulose synthase/poly-beta-1,6-N-acetylglucosamine synthase-like glycosyltransferase
MLIDMAGFALLFTLAPGALYLLVLTLASLPLIRQRHRLTEDLGVKSTVDADTPARIAIVVPAHDEAPNIRATVRSLLSACANDSACQIFVLADNCSDDTAAIAARENITVLVRSDPSSYGKGPALTYAFAQLPVFDWYVVIDADCRVDVGFLPALRAVIRQDVAALQCRYLGACDCDAATPRPAAYHALSRLAWFGWNLVRPRGRANMGLSAGILGSGFGISRATLDRVPYESTSIVEDADYHIRLVQAGMRVHWVEQATVRAPPAPDRVAATTQRARWTGGRLALLRKSWLPVVRLALSGEWRMFDIVFDLLLPPLSWLVAASVLLTAWPTRTVALGAMAIIATVALHVAIAMAAGGATRHHWLALLRLPAYFVWSLSSLPRSFEHSRNGAAWIRTARRTSSRSRK